MSKRKAFVVDRARWLRGKDRSVLRNRSGRMCCLGFVCTQLGVPAKKITNIDTPAGVEDAIMLEIDADRVLVRVVGDLSLNSDLTAAAMGVNDDEDIGDAERERQLRALFRKHGRSIRFTGPKRDARTP